MSAENNTLDPMKLSDATLEGVVGGLDDLQRKAVVCFVENAKRNGKTLDEAIDRALHPRFGGSHFDDEMIQYMIECWNDNQQQ